MTVYDKLDWHLDGAIKAGQPEGNAFAHMGLYLDWLVRRDMTNPEFIRADWAAAIKRAEMTASDLASALDGVLASDMLTAEGRAFTDFYYESFLTDYSAVFSTAGDYAVVDDEDSFARIAPVIDERYNEWVSAGRPQGTSRQESLEEMTPEALADRAGMSQEDHAELRRQIRSQLADIEVRAASWSHADVEPPPVAASRGGPSEELERLARAVSEKEPHLLMSRTGAEWGDPLVKRVLKRLGVAPKEATVTTGMWPGGSPTVILYRVPGADPDRMPREFESAIHVGTGAHMEDAMVAGKSVRLARGDEFTVAYWVVSPDLVVHVAVTDPATLDDVVARLP